MATYYKGAIMVPGSPTSARAIYDAGFSVGDGLYWINNKDNGKSFQVYCDMTTADENGNKGWMMVASWDTGSSWSLNSTSSASTFSTTPLNCFSSNFGNFDINSFRVTATSSLSSLGTSASGGDWYYYWSTAIKWKQVWAYTSGTNKNYMNNTTGDVAGNITGNPGPAPVNAGGGVARVCMRLFDYAYNIKWSYKASTQRWNNFSDSEAAGQQNWSDFWNGLTTPGYTLKGGVTSGDDGTLGIIPSGDSSTTAAHDCNYNNFKVGYDDSGVTAWYGSSATANMNANVAVTNNYPLFFWIR